MHEKIHGFADDRLLKGFPRPGGIRRGRVLAAAVACAGAGVMAERVQLLRGSLDVECEPGRGTRIRASFPLTQAPEQPAEPEE